MVDSSASSRMTEKTFVLAYPCHYTYRFLGEIVSEFESLGLEIREMGCMHVNKAFALEHTGPMGMVPDEFAPFPYKDLVHYLVSKPVVAMIVEGKGAINTVHSLITGKQPPFWAGKGWRLLTPALRMIKRKRILRGGLSPST